MKPDTNQLLTNPLMNRVFDIWLLESIISWSSNMSENTHFPF